MQHDTICSHAIETLRLRVELIPIPAPDNQHDYRIRIENITTGEIQILDTLDAFEERIATLVDPLF